MSSVLCGIYSMDKLKFFTAQCFYIQIRFLLSRHVRRRKFGNYNFVTPAVVSPIRIVPDEVKTPKYYKNGKVPPEPSEPELVTTQRQLDGMRQSCRMARQVLELIQPVVKVGTTTDELDAFAHDLIISKGAYPSPLYYRGFPKSICTSVNNVVCHGIPDSRPLHNGDIVNIDVTVFYNGFHGDCSAMFLVGEVDDKGKHLVAVTLEALNNAISICKPGALISSIGNIVEKTAKENNLKVVPDFAGHGINTYFHGPPDVVHYANRHPGRMVPGMTFTIEPILSQGSHRMMILNDSWTSVTVDGARTAQWEHTVLITESGVEILTAPDYVLPA